MQKIGDSTSTANVESEFTEGNPGAGVDATLLKAAWLNAIQRELVNVVEGAGIGLDPENDAQLLAALQEFKARASDWPNITNKPTSRDGYGLADVHTKTEISEALSGKADRATTLAGYGVDPASQEEAEAEETYDNTKPTTMLRVFQFFTKKVVQATESIRGTARFSTPEEASEGLSGSTMVSPQTMAAQFPFRGVAALINPGTFTWDVPPGTAKAWVKVIGGGGGGARSAGISAGVAGPGGVEVAELLKRWSI